MMRRAFLGGALGAALMGLSLGPFIATAASPTVAQVEVEYLLSAVAGSGCEFYRNGEWYDSRRASAHLRDKYNALVALGHAATAMDFIEKAATKSSMSGRPYLIRCAGGAPVQTNQWLREALERYRRCPSSPNTCASWRSQDAQETGYSTPIRPVSRLS